MTKWERIKMIYNIVLEEISPPTKGERSIRHPYVKSYKNFMYYFKGLGKVIRLWERKKRRVITKLSKVRWKLTSQEWKIVCPLIDPFWIIVTAWLCDGISEELGLIYDPKYYRYSRPKGTRKRRERRKERRRRRKKRS